MLVWTPFKQTTEAVTEGFEAAWHYWVGVITVVIPDLMRITTAGPQHRARFNHTSIECFQSCDLMLDRGSHPKANRRGTVFARAPY